MTAKTKKLRALSAEINVNEIEFKSRDNQIELYKSQLLEVKQELLKEVSQGFSDELIERIKKEFLFSTEKGKTKI